MRKGLTLPNRAFDPYTAAELAALDDLQPSVLVMLLYGGRTDQTHRAQLGPFLSRGRDLPTILYRPYAGNILDWDPPDWARECQHRIRDVGLVGELIPANELNLASEGGSTNWGDHIHWLTLFARSWRQLEPTVPLHLPALSPTGDWLEGLYAYRTAGLDKLYDRIDCHAYGGNAGVDVVSVADRFPRNPIDVTEFNGIAPEDFAYVADRCESATWFILGGTPDQSAYDLLRQPTYYASFKKWKESPLPIPEFASPNHDGPRESTVGVVIHATLGPSLSPDTEYTATVNWFQDPASQVSAHAVVGPGGQVHRSVRTDEIAWHCRASNKTWLGIEMAHPFSQFQQPIAPDILDAAAKVVAGWCHDFEIPIQWSTVSGLAEHHEMPTNTDGHQDVGGPFDRADFLNRVKHYAGEDDLTNEQKAKLADHLNILWGETKADTIKANPAESERACHERIVAIKELLGVNG